jgi:hypothetical protein
MATGFVKDSSSTLYWINKGPGEDLNYGINWSKPTDNWLGDGNTITQSTWVVSPTGVSPALQQHGPTTNAGYAIVWLKDGVVGQKYIVTNNIVTSDGRKGSRSFEVRIINR